MIHVRLLAFAALLPLTLACRSAFASQGAPPPKSPSAGLLPPAKTAIEIAVGQNGAPNLSVLLQQLTSSTGVNFTADDEVRRMLESIPCGVLASVTVPPAEAWVWVESLLQHEGLALAVLSANEPVLAAVYPLQPRGNRTSSPSYFTVPSTQLDALAEHPALFVSMVLDLPHTDVRQLGNSLRGLTTDPTGQQNVTPVGNTNAVILSGMGRQVHQLATMLREIDASMAQWQAQQAATESQAAGATGGNPAR